MKCFFTLLVFSFLFSPLNLFGCLNYYHTLDQDGDFHEMTENGFVGFNKNFNYKLIASKLPDLEAEFQNYHSPYLLSDYAVFLMKAGKIEESLALLVELNKNLPNEYQIAANLGTAYELNGELDSALFYINRGMELNPDAHEGSEWVHVKILEVKLKQIQDPNYLNNTSVLKLAAEQKADYKTRRQLEIQIRERFPFTPGPDEIMASLMLDLGDCYAANLSIEYAKAFYTIAEIYYGTDPAITDPKIEKMVALRVDYKDISPPTTTSDGNDIRLTGVSYKSIIDDNNRNNYRIDWNEYNTDVESLLAKVDYSVKENLLLEEDEQPSVKEIDSDDKSNETLWTGILVLCCLCLLGTIIYIILRIFSR